MTDSHAEALEAAVRVLLAQVERAVRAFIAQAPYHVALWTRSRELQAGPREGLPEARSRIHPQSRRGSQSTMDNTYTYVSYHHRQHNYHQRMETALPFFFIDCKEAH